MKIPLKSLLKQYLALTFILLTALFVSAQTKQTVFQNSRAHEAALAPGYLPNPVKLNPYGDCLAQNIRRTMFSAKYSSADRAKLCSLLDQLRLKLWRSRRIVGELDYQIGEIWKVAPYLFFEKVGWMQSVFSGVYGHAVYQQILQTDGSILRRGIISLRLNEKTFPHTFLHELRHVRDLYDGYNGRKVFSAQQLEENAFLLESYFTEATADRAAFFKEFWRSEWRAISRAERRRLALEDIARYMRKHY